MQDFRYMHRKTRFPARVVDSDRPRAGVRSHNGSFVLYEFISVLVSNSATLDTITDAKRHYILKKHE